jgi:ABC-2 type transport system permease protein
VSTDTAAATNSRHGHGGPSTGSLVAAEFLKIRSTRLWWALLLGAVLFTAFGAGFTAGFAGVEGGTGPGGQALPPVESAELLRSVYGAGFSGAYIFALILGVTGMTGEYRYMTITPTFLGAPRRHPVVLAKLVAHLIAGIVYGVVCALVAVVVGGLIIVAFKDGSLGLTADGVPRAVGLSIVAVALWTLLGIGLGTLIRNQIAAILTGVLIAFLVEPLLGLAFNALDLEVGKYLPTSASNALLSGFTGGAAQLDWWAGGLVLLGYAVLFSAIGVAFSVRRDIT